MTKIVGIKIATSSPDTKDKIYYYKTNDTYKKGDKLDVIVPSGGTPNAVVVIEDSKKKFNREIKELEKV